MSAWLQKSLWNIKEQNVFFYILMNHLCEMSRIVSSKIASSILGS